MKVRAKMDVTNIEETTVTFNTNYDPANTPEDNSFAAATPSATATFNIDNPEALKAFEKGKSYYFDITPVEQPEEEQQEVTE